MSPTATTVKIDGKLAKGFWYFEKSADDPKYPMKVSFVPYTANPPAYALGIHTLWPANSTVEMAMKTNGISAGRGLVFDDNLSLTMNIDDAHISTVDCAAGVERMVSRSNGAMWHTFPVSCGSAQHPTYTGVKVVMQKGENVPGTDKLRPNGTVLMSGDGYTDTPVEWSVRITLSGEYVHSAPWNGLIGRSSTSHGCTNLFPDPAKWFYNFSNIGDVVTYDNTGGQLMPALDGLGDWNIPWSQWAEGGLLLNH